MRILLVNTSDSGGGAERVALDLYRMYGGLGHDVRMLVRYKKTSHQSILEANAYQYTSPLSSLFEWQERLLKRSPAFRGQYRLVDWTRRNAYPPRWLCIAMGREDFNYPYASHILDNLNWTPDVIHAHNLHGDYFDLRAFEVLGRRIPIVWTLHDTWALTGHCAYFIDCERWSVGCGKCPDLKRQPPLAVDGTAKNYQTKKRIYEKSKFAVATPSRWLMNHVERSILQGKERRVIPNGIDLSIFKLEDKQAARRALGLPKDAFICLYVSFYGGQPSAYKDYTTISRAIEILILSNPDVLFLCVGGLPQQTRQARSLHTGFIENPKTMAFYYQAADVLLHAANAENFPLVILESLACSTPVVATDVGGIAEQVIDAQTGFLVPRGDSDAMAARVLFLQEHPDICQQMGISAAIQAQKKYDLDAQAKAYLNWFEELRAYLP